MFKQNTKVLALLLTAVMMISAFSACSGSDSTASQAPAEDSGGAAVSPETNEDSGGQTVAVGTYTIGYLNWGQGVPILDSFMIEAQYASEALGNSLSVISDQFNANQQLTNVQNLIAADVDAIMVDAVMLTLISDIASQCEQAKMPFLFYNHVTSAEQHAELQNNPYYIGSISTDGVAAAAMLAEMAIADGNTTAVCIGGAVGDTTNDERINTFTAVFESAGGKVLGSARCTDPTESPTKSEDMMSAYPDA